MKKYLGAMLVVLTMFIFGSVNNSFALNFGVHMGAGSSSYSGEIDTFLGSISEKFSEEETVMFGFHMTTDYPDSAVQIQTELNYINEDFDLFNEDIVHHNFAYLQLPIIIKVNTPEFRHVKMFAGLGPYASILLADNRDIMEKYDYGYILSTGISVNCDNVENAITVELRHSQGLCNVSDIDGLNMKNSKNMILVGFNF